MEYLQPLVQYLFVLIVHNMSSTYTLTFSEGVQGWPSFYSYEPESMVGMNQYLYSFKGGNLYRHNTNETRNNFYERQYSSTIKSVVNDTPLENKLFKTLNLEGDAPWSATLESDLQATGFIESSYFDLKEASYYAFIRNDFDQAAPWDPNSPNSSQFPLQSVQGIGTSLTTGTGVINYALNFQIPKSLSVGDYVYHNTSAPTSVGAVTSIEVDIPSGINRINVSGTVPVTDEVYFFFMKNSIAESNGILGHYCVFELTNTSTSPVELFAVESEVMKSFP